MPAPQMPRPPRPVRSTRRIRLGRSDFVDGPYVITESDVEIILTEDVELNFADPPLGAKSPLHLGFFGGIVIGASRVVINLNGHTLKMHPNYRERQRFFALIALDITPFPIGKARFTTEPKRPADITVRNGTLGLTSHFAIHGNTLEEGRILVSDVQMHDFEVGAISISGASDILIRRCTIGSAIPPTTTSDVNMFIDLAKTVRERGSKAEADALMNLASVHARKMQASDALVRAIVINPQFNVNGVPDSFEKRISRVAIVDTTFDDLRAEPIETVGITTVKGDDNALKDVNGNLIAYADAKAGAMLSRLQAAFHPELPKAARDKLMSGPSSAFHPVYGQDRRGHALQAKASLFVRIDGCDDITLQNLNGASVKSYGNEGAAVGLMLNGCERISVMHVRIGGVEIHNVCSDPLSDERPQSGLLIRRCRHIKVDSYTYESKHSCGGSFRHAENAAFQRCKMNAPTTFLKCKHVVLE